MDWMPIQAIFHHRRRPRPQQCRPRPSPSEHRPPSLQHLPHRRPKRAATSSSSSPPSSILHLLHLRPHRPTPWPQWQPASSLKELPTLLSLLPHHHRCLPILQPPLSSSSNAPVSSTSLHPSFQLQRKPNWPTSSMVPPSSAFVWRSFLLAASGSSLTEAGRAASLDLQLWIVLVCLGFSSFQST